MITTGVCHYRDIMGPHMSTNNKEKGATEMSGRISDGVGVRRRRYNMISVMEAFMRKSKSSIPAVSAPMPSHGHCLSPLLLCVFFFLSLNKTVTLHRCSNWVLFSRPGLKHKHTHTHTQSATHAVFVPERGSLGGSSGAVLRDSKDPPSTHSPPTPTPTV